MGAAQSFNGVDTVLKAVAEATSNIANNTKLTADSSQIINISHVKGDVIIKGMTMEQTVTVNLQATMKALANQETQQKVLNDMAQQAASVVSGINFGQYASATNSIKQFLSVTSRIVNNMTLTCSGEVNTKQVISVDNVTGNVVIQDSVLRIFVSALSQCVQDATASSSSMQDVVNKLQQLATAKAQGVDLWQLAAVLAGLLIGMPLATGSILGKRGVIGMVLLVGGMGVAAYAFKFMCRQAKGAEPLVYPHAVAPSSLDSAQKFTDVTLDQAVAKLAQGQMVYYERYKADSDGAPALLPKATAYVMPAQLPVVVKPMIRYKLNLATDTKPDPKDSGTTATMKPGDAYLHSESGTYYVMTEDGWQRRGKVQDVKPDVLGAAKKLGWGHGGPLDGYDVWIMFYYERSRLNHNVRVKKADGTWQDVPGTLNIDTAFTPRDPNTTVVAGMPCDTTATNVVLATGGTIAAVGLLVLLSAGFQKKNEPGHI
ncbi:hypothetical protein IJGMMPBP_00008 [Infectious spleen and kidney necrosis virus]|uniref:Myristylated membrane protein n=1 Tax=Infectious spleen and kidney necrosis virus TaxID=180170 RepID=A0A7U1GIM0_ISKNV|nr:hypothetical protein IJGMMPBP_00008 [Infectious spleen and kidney necrosis virus]QQZ00678.1 hypothetical protein NIDBEMMG_00103 [Infectious spleen and kidney necrosis virus]